MEIVRRVYCRKRYEGLYQLVRSNDKYYWIYITGTMKNDNTLHPILNISWWRVCWFSAGVDKNGMDFYCGSIIKFKKGDLNGNYSKGILWNFLRRII